MRARGRNTAGAHVPLLVTFDAEAFVNDLLTAGCRVSVQQPIGRDAGPAYVWVARTVPDGTPTVGEREVRARWGAAMAACPDAGARVLAVCQRRAERHLVRRARRLRLAGRLDEAAAVLERAGSGILTEREPGDAP